MIKMIEGIFPFAAKRKRNQPMGSHQYDPSKCEFRAPHLTDWAFRPAQWTTRMSAGSTAVQNSRTQFGQGVALFHDADEPNIQLGQVKNDGPKFLPAFAVTLKVSDFGGGFLSLSVDLPADIITGLSNSNLVHVEICAEMAGVQRVYGQLNIENGPNIERLPLELAQTGETFAGGFDLHNVPFNIHTTKKLWVDISFDIETACDVTLRDLAIYRRRRASI